MAFLSKEWQPQKKMQASNQNGKQKFKSAYEANHYESFDMFWLSKMKQLEASDDSGSGKTS